MRDPLQVHQLLRNFGLEPRKSLGQNFLMDQRFLSRILEAAELSAQDQVLEIGPGLGGLTRALAERAGRVTAVELDGKLVAALKETLSDLPNVTLVNADILDLDIGENMGRAPYKVVANLPYNITSVALRHLLGASPRPSLLVLMVQKEVAQRIVAEPGEMSLLAVSVQFYGQPRLVTKVPAGAFFPVPKVDSAILRIETFPQPMAAEADSPRFFSLARAGFGQRRKQLRNSLAHGLGLPTALIEERLRACALDPQRRAESLSLAEWGMLLRAFDAIPLPKAPGGR